MKKTYIPSTPRSRKLKSVGGGTINVSGGSAQNVPVIEGHTHDNKIILDAITQLHLRILSSLNVDEDGALIVELSNIIKELDATVPTDENLFSALRTVLEIRARSISKTDPDTAQEIIKFVKGIEIGTFTTGPLGAGAAIKMENGVSRMEVDQLDVRMRATFRELIIESLKHIGGQLILSPARMKCTSVVDGGTYYRCYFDTGDGKVSNEFVAGDQARCQVFTGSGVKMYWRLVTSVGTDWINLSKTDAISGSSIPEAGDDIVQLGNRSDVTRQNAQILSTVGADAPSWKQYKGINSFSLEGKDTTVFSGTGNKIDGKTVFVSSGSNLDDWAAGTSQDVQDAQAAANAAALAAQQAIDDAAANVGLINTEVGKLQAQIDGEVSNWFYPYSPTLANYPASDWTTNTIKDRHIGDTFTNTAQAPATDAGKSWRFVKNGTVYSWTQIADSDAVLALQKAAQAQSTADGKSTTYLIQPTSYKLGDMWVLAADQTVNGTAYKAGEILTATQDSTTYNQAHWVKKVRYTDDTAVNNLQIGGRNYLKNSATQVNTTRFYELPIYEDVKSLLNKTVILSFDMRTNSGGFLRNIQIYPYQNNGITIGLVGNFANTSLDVWERFSLTTTIIQAGTNPNYTAGSIGFYDTVGYNNYSLKNFKIELGSKATDWTPAPEDVQAEIDAAVVKATYWSVKASTPVIYKDAINAATAGTHTPVTVSGELRSGTTTTSGGFITVTPNGGTEAGTASASPVTIAPANGDGKTSYTVKLYDTAAKTTLLDTMTIPVVFKGASGVNAINAILSNEADVLPASSEGVVSDYTGSGTEIRVFEGATELSYGTGNGQYQVSAVGSGITVGTPSTSGNRRVYGVASNMTSDNATITFTITGKTASGTSFSLTKVQAFAKSKTGQKGDQGPQGIPGVPGADGVTYYTWIRYADTPTSGMSQYPTGKDYIGIAYNKTTPTESSNYSDYNWSLIKGEQGLPGQKGADGIQYYTWIKYADSPTSGMSDNPAGKAYIGIAVNKTTATESTNYADYTWQLTKGEKGDTGASAPLLYLSASAQVMKCNPDNTPQTGQTISIEAKLQNVSGTATFVATPYNDAGVAQTPVTLGGTGNTRTLTNSQWLATYKRIEVVATLGSLNDKVTIYRVADGATGATGQNAIVGLLTNESVTLQANNAGVVSSFTPANGEFWVYNGTTKVTSGITFSKVSQTGCTAAITSAGVYSVSAMSADNATVVLRAVYGGVTIDKVLTLSKSRAGADGVSITLVDVEFAKNTSPTTAPTTGWTTTAPTLAEGEQLWTRTKTTYSSGNPTYSTPANITPKTGTTGTGIDSVTEEYAISTSKTTQPTTGWSTTQPTWVQGQYIWSRVKVVYKNPASTVYTGYAVSSEWEAINNIEIGGRNYFRHLFTDPYQNNSVQPVNGWYVVDTGQYGGIIFSTAYLEEGNTYTISFEYKTTDNSGWYTISSPRSATPVKYNSNKTLNLITDGKVHKKIFQITATATEEVSIVLLREASSGTVYYKENSLKVEKGNKATDWTPAPEDVQAAIDAEKTRINDILSDNVADPSEKQYLSNLWQEIYAEYPRIWAQANTYAVDKSNYEAKYSALNTLLSPVLANLTTNSTVSGASIRTAFSQYYDARTFLLNNITNKVNTTAADAQAKANISKAVTDTFKTTVNGGLISTVMILLRELNSIIETAGISGIQDDGYLPAYWSGGTYAEALAFGELMRAVDRGDNPIASATLNAKMSSIVMLHNGHAKVGELIIKSNGQIIILDKATGKIKFVINSQNIPSVAELMGGTAFGETKTNSSVSGITGIITLQNTISVDKNNSTLSFAADISLTLRNYTKIADASMSVDLFKNGVLYLNLGSLSVVKLDESTPPVTDSYSISKTISGIPTGTYSVKITVVASGDVRDYAGSISASTLAWNFTQSGVRYFQLGLDGLMAFYSDNHFHYTETGGLDVRGATNMPGVLAKGRIASNGARDTTKAWGAKNSTSSVTKPSGTGSYRVPVNCPNADYDVNISPRTANRLFYVGATTATYFDVYFQDRSGVAQDSDFSYTLVGNNY